MANDYFLFLIPFPLNCDLFYITLSLAALSPIPFSTVASLCNHHLNLQRGL